VADANMIRAESRQILGVLLFPTADHRGLHRGYMMALHGRVPSPNFGAFRIDKCHREVAAIDLRDLWR
jgi:hypothetical protein